MTLRWYQIGAISLMLFHGSPQSYAIESLGRLFFSPEQRRLLDQQRHHLRNTQSRSAVAEPQHIALNGYLIDDQGRQITWVNGAIHPPLSAGRFTVSLSPAQPHTLIIGVQQKRIPLKVGQTLEVGTGVIYDPLNGQLKMHP